MRVQVQSIFTAANVNLVITPLASTQTTIQMTHTSGTPHYFERSHYDAQIVAIQDLGQCFSANMGSLVDTHGCGATYMTGEAVGS